MKYQADYVITPRDIKASEAEISIEKEGVRLGETFLDFADILQLRPISHRIFLDLSDGGYAEISMLGFSYDGFYEELMKSFGDRSLEALFVEEAVVMDCEGEYSLPSGSGASGEQGRARILLYPDAVCILPHTSHAVRIPLCFTTDIILDGYRISLTMRTGETFTVGKMGYDTKPFAERCLSCAKTTIAERERMMKELSAEPPFLHPGLFRTIRKEESWGAAFGEGRCAVELYTGENAATYLYAFSDRSLFLYRLEEAMEAVGTHREIIFLPDEQLNEKPLCRMVVQRSRAVRFLRSCTSGRLIHNAAHAEKLQRFLQGE